MKTNHYPINLVFCIDEKFSFPLGILIQSLIETSTKPLRLHILCSSLSESNQTRLASYISEGVSVDFYQVDSQMLGALTVSECFSERLSVATYFRFLLTSFIPADIDRVLFLDADMLALQNVAPIFDIELGNAFAAVVEDAKLTELKRWLPLELASGYYFNAGMMLIDMKKWRCQGISELCIQEALNHPEWEYNDQDVLNVVLDGKVKLVSPVWNLQSFSVQQNTNFQPVLVHYTGSEKPWQVSCIHPYKDNYLNVYRRSAYGDVAIGHYLDHFDRQLIAKVEQFIPVVKELVIYGCGQRGRRLYHFLCEHFQDIVIQGFIDKRSLGEYDGLPVLNEWQNSPTSHILICSAAYRSEIEHQLIENGALPEHII